MAKTTIPAPALTVRSLIDRLFAFLRHPITLAFFKLLLGMLFILSSISKIENPAKFADAIEAYKIVPGAFVWPMVYTMPWIQIIAGACLILDIFAQSASFVISGLLVVYIIAISQAWARGFEMECGCFDLIEALEDKVGWRSIVRDLVLLGMSGCVFLFDRNGLNFWGLFNRKSQISDVKPTAAVSVSKKRNAKIKKQA
ncbi:MAG: DoxX family membrane protein [Spirochaetia bacterium]|nr:DoxX family membrane protein [Spirochaetia bacterium]